MIKTLATDIAAFAAALLLCCGVAAGQSIPDTTAAPGGTQNTLKFTTVLMALPVGTLWFHLRLDAGCRVDAEARRATGDREPQDLPPYTGVFKTEFERAGFKVSADEDLFSRESSGAADYQVAAVITDAQIIACVSSGGIFVAGKKGDVGGTGSMKVDWQVYSPLRKEVVARVSTSGAIDLEKPVSDGMSQLILSAFADNLRQLAANAEFRTAMSAKPLTPNDVLLAGQQSKIALAGSQKATMRPIADAVGSVVTLLTGSGTGSGVLLSDDDYILTNAHAVGEEKEIRVRWSDGIEKVGQIIRVAKARDVALLKTDPRGRPPLPILRGPVTPGQRVYAIGSPNGATFGIGDAMDFLNLEQK